jgi:hypothetical protein
MILVANANEDQSEGDFSKFIEANMDEGMSMRGCLRTSGSAIGHCSENKQVMTVLSRMGFRGRVVPEKEMVEGPWAQPVVSDCYKRK